MLQFYLLSVLANGLAGYTLFFGDSSGQSSLESNGIMEWKCGFSVKAETYRLVLGILSAVAGLFKILSSTQGDLPLIGDIIPAMIGFLCGFVLIMGNRGSKSADADASESAEGQAKKTSGFLVANKKLLGAAAMISAVLHFLLPTALFL